MRFITTRQRENEMIRFYCKMIWVSLIIFTVFYWGLAFELKDGVERFGRYDMVFWIVLVAWIVNIVVGSLIPLYRIHKQRKKRRRQPIEVKIIKLFTSEDTRRN